MVERENIFMMSSGYSPDHPRRVTAGHHKIIILAPPWLSKESNFMFLGPPANRPEGSCTEGPASIT